MKPTNFSASLNLKSWGRHFNYRHNCHQIIWQDDIDKLSQLEGLRLPYGLGRSYGDSCLNDGHQLIVTSQWDRLIKADWKNGIIRCQSGMSLDALLRVAVPQGYFVPVTPGTKFVTVGGAIANDVHGKNHHSHGTFGCHVLAFELMRSDGESLVCSLEKNAELFAATIGGLGLTGLINWVDLQLIEIASAQISCETIKFEGIDEFIEISQDSDHRFTYTVAWFDCMTESNRGHFIRGNHSSTKTPLVAHRSPWLNVPFDWPQAVLNPLSMKAFNALYFHRFPKKARLQESHYDSFFYPLDAIHHWNRIYGKQGLFQYQFVLPMEEKKAFNEVLDLIRQSRQGSFLAVIKTFGSCRSPGMLSFPMPGFTLSLDFANRGDKTLNLLQRLESKILSHGGRFYPAKDSMMSPAAFAASMPRLAEFLPLIDEQFSSNFWRRVYPDALTSQSKDSLGMPKRSFG